MESIPLRENIVAARKLLDKALELIDDVINFHRKYSTEEVRSGDPSCCEGG